VRREEILRATCSEVANRGFAHTRVADVARALGISTGLVFYHFDSKDALLSAAFAYAASRDLTRLDSAASSSGTVLERLSVILRMYGPEDSGADWALWIDAWATALRSEAMTAVSQELDGRWKDTVAGLIRQGVDSGDLTCPDPDGAAWRLLALLDGLALQCTVHEAAVTKDQVDDWVRKAAALELGVDLDEQRD